MKLFAIYVSALRLIQWATLCSVLCGAIAQGAVEIIPVPSTGADGPTASATPFVFNAIQTSTRYQQVYDAAAFSAIGQEGGLITSLFWGSDLIFGRGDWGAYLPRVDILLAITPRGPDQLSSIFAENLGASPASIVHTGPLLLVSGGRGSRVDLPFQTPFSYNPANGNLLLEIRVYEPTCCIGVPQLNVGPLDAYDVIGDAVSRVYGGGVDATAGSVDTLGLTTYFVVTPVPEPAAWLLALLSILICFVWTRRNRNTTTVAKD